MAPKRKSGRATAEAAYANLLKEHTALVGDVGEAFDAYVALLEDAAAGRERYENARAAAVKAGALTNDQLDQMGYAKTAKLPAAPTKTPPEESPKPGSVESPAPSAPPLANGGAPPMLDPVTVGTGANGTEPS